MNTKNVILTLAIATVLLIAAVGTASAHCNQTANPDTCHGCCYHLGYPHHNIVWCYECGDTASKCALDTNMTCSGTALTLGSSQPAVDGNNHYISGDGTGTGIYVPGCSGVFEGIRHLEIKNFEKGIWFQDGDYDYNVFECKIHDNGMGIHLDHLDQRGCLVRDCEIYDNNGEGIHIDNVRFSGSSASFAMKDNEIHNNAIGIYCEGEGKSENVDYVIGIQNTVEGNDDGITIEGNNWSINYNTVRYNNVGINVTDGSEDATLTGNTVCYNEETDIYVETATSASGDENTCDSTYNYNDTGTEGCTNPCPAQDVGCIGEETGTVYGCGATVSESCTFNGNVQCGPATSGLFVGKGNIVIDGAGYKISGSVAIAECPCGESSPCVTHSGIINNDGYNDVVVKDVEIESFCTGVVIGPTELARMIVTGCKIHDCGHPGSTEKTNGIHMVKPDYCNITKNEIYNISGGPIDDCGGGGNGMFIRTHADHNTVTCNRIYDTEKTGIFAKYQCMHNYVGYNYITGNPESGINPMCMMSNYNTFEYNNLSNNIGSGYSTGGTGNNLRYNTVHNNPWGGIYATSGGNSATNNSACGNGYTDISANSCDDNTCGTGCGCDWNCDNLVPVYFDFDGDGHYSTIPENCVCSNVLGVGACCNPGLFNASHAAMLNASGICWLTPGDDTDDCPSVTAGPPPPPPITPKPFVISGWITDINGNAVNNSNVTVRKITKIDDKPYIQEEIFAAKTSATSNYYRLVVDSEDVNASELRIIAVNESATGCHIINVTDFNVTEGKINDGGIFNFNLSLDVFYLDLKDFPMRVSNASACPNPPARMFKISGAAVAQMNLDYMWWNRSVHEEPPIKYNQSYLYNYSLQYNEDPLLEYTDARGMYYTIQNLDPSPYWEYGYNFGLISRTDNNTMMKYICHWICYPAGRKENYSIHVPGAVPAYGDYSNWMSVRGVHTNKNAYPSMSGLEVYGFWVNDPWPLGIGENSYKTAEEWLATYYLPLNTSDSWDGKYVAILEPPEEDDGSEVIIAASPARFNAEAKQAVQAARTQAQSEKGMDAGMRVMGAEGGDADAVEEANKWIVEAAINGAMEQLAPYDEEFADIFKDVVAVNPLLVKNDAGDYYLVPFNTENEEETLVVIIVDAEDGHFKEASWVKEPMKYLPVSEEDALTIVSEGIGAVPDGADTELVRSDSSSSSSPYYPDWKVTVDGKVFYVGQDGTVSCDEPEPPVYSLYLTLDIDENLGDESAASVDPTGMGQQMSDYAMEGIQSCAPIGPDCLPLEIAEEMIETDPVECWYIVDESVGVVVPCPEPEPTPTPTPPQYSSYLTVDIDEHICDEIATDIDPIMAGKVEYYACEDGIQSCAPIGPGCLAEEIAQQIIEESPTEAWYITNEQVGVVVPCPS